MCALKGQVKSQPGGTGAPVSEAYRNFPDGGLRRTKLSSHTRRASLHQYDLAMEYANTIIEAAQAHPVTAAVTGAALLGAFFFLRSSEPKRKEVQSIIKDPKVRICDSRCPCDIPSHRNSLESFTCFNFRMDLIVRACWLRFIGVLSADWNDPFADRQLSPFCCKLETYLKLAKIPYEVVKGNYYFKVRLCLLPFAFHVLMILLSDRVLLPRCRSSSTKTRCKMTQVSSSRSSVRSSWILTKISTKSNKPSQLLFSAYHPSVFPSVTTALTPFPPFRFPAGVCSKSTSAKVTPSIAG